MKPQSDSKQNTSLIDNNNNSISKSYKIIEPDQTYRSNKQDENNHSYNTEDLGQESEEQL